MYHHNITDKIKTKATRRIVKFRVINPTTGKIIGYERLMLTDKGGVWQFSIDDKEWEAGIFESEDWLRDQASGIYGAYHKEFYENDIVARGIRTNAVTFRNGRFGMIPRRMNWAYPDRTTVFPLDSKLVIVGTLHTTPELLEDNQ